MTPQSLLVLDFRGLGLERWLILELAPQLASQTHSLPFEFRALEAILQHKVKQIKEENIMSRYKQNQKKKKTAGIDETLF